MRTPPIDKNFDLIDGTLTAKTSDLEKLNLTGREIEGEKAIIHRLGIYAYAGINQNLWGT